MYEHLGYPVEMERCRRSIVRRKNIKLGRLVANSWQIEYLYTRCTIHAQMSAHRSSTQNKLQAMKP